MRFFTKIEDLGLFHQLHRSYILRKEIMSKSSLTLEKLIRLNTQQLTFLVSILK